MSQLDAAIRQKAQAYALQNLLKIIHEMTATISASELLDFLEGSEEETIIGKRLINTKQMVQKIKEKWIEIEL